MTSSLPLISNTHGLALFVSLIAGIFGITMLFVVGFFVLEQIGWLDFNHPETQKCLMKEENTCSSSSTAEVTEVNKMTNPGMTWMMKDIKPIPRAKLKNVDDFGDSDAVGYVNKLFSDILRDEQTEDEEPQSSTVAVIHENKSDKIRTKEPAEKRLKGLQILPPFKPGRNVNELSSFKPLPESRPSVQTTNLNHQISTPKMDATAL